MLRFLTRHAPLTGNHIVFVLGKISCRVMVDCVRFAVRGSSSFQSHPKGLKITQDGVDAALKVILVLVGHALIGRTLHGGHCMLHRFLMGGFKLSVKCEIGDVHVGVAICFQGREPRD